MNSASSLTDIVPIFFVKKYKVYVIYEYPAKTVFKGNKNQGKDLTIDGLDTLTGGYIQNQWDQISSQQTFNKLFMYLTTKPKIKVAYIWGNLRKNIKYSSIHTGDFIDSSGNFFANIGKGIWNGIGNFGSKAFVLPLGLFNNVGNDTISKVSETIFGNFFQDNFVKNHTNERSINFYLQQLFKNSFHPIILLKEQKAVNNSTHTTTSHNSDQGGVHTSSTIAQQEINNIQNSEYNFLTRSIQYKNSINLHLMTVKNNLWFKLFDGYMNKWLSGNDAFWGNFFNNNNSLVAFYQDLFNAFDSTDFNESKFYDKNLDSLMTNGNDETGFIKNNSDTQSNKTQGLNFIGVKTFKNNQQEVEKVHVIFEVPNKFQYLINYYGKDLMVLNAKITNYTVEPAEKGNRVDIALQLDGSKNEIFEYNIMNTYKTNRTTENKRQETAQPDTKDNKIHNTSTNALNNELSKHPLVEKSAKALYKIITFGLGG